MRKTQIQFILKTIAVMAILFSLKSLQAQTADYENFQSVITVPPMSSPFIRQPYQRTDVTNGFDNFYLGVDFGEPYIATNPRDVLNSI